MNSYIHIGTVWQQFMKSLATHVNQVLMITALYKNVATFFEVFVDDRLYAVGRANGWQGTGFTVVKQFSALIFACQLQIAI